MLEKQYQPTEVEDRIYRQWEESGAFKSQPERVEKGAKPYCIVIPPPNVTGSLHMGHALNNTIQDILVRFERMRGKDVLWQPGTDHAGIATQMVVERQLMQNQEPGRREMGREAFLERVWNWKHESGGAIINQLRRLGASCDWSRERFTMDEGLSRAVLKVFIELYEAGLIYRDKRLVNWDPKLQTAISDLEVLSVETQGHMWHFKYPVKGEEGRFITVATTRPETMLGDTAVAVNGEDERYQDLIGKTCILPLVDREIPIVADEHADPEQGSGAVKITPAHDFNDFEVGRRHDLELINIFDSHACLNENAPEAFRGMDRFEARDKIVEAIRERGLLEKIDDHTLMVPYGDRSNVVIEPWLTDQWYVDAKTLAEPAIKAVEQGATVFVPRNWEKTYYEWMKNIQPWCISRQLWWGHQIPVWYGPDEEIFVAYDEAGAMRKAEAHYGKPVELRRDEDVLDTWFSSALWPFSTLGWPDKTPELQRYYQTDVLVTGFDIIFFWVARMMMMGLHFKNEAPFHTVYVHALVRDEKGAKMSKSKGNVMDPLDIVDGIELEPLVEKRLKGLLASDAGKIEKSTRKEYPDGIPAYGTDALRFTLAAMAAQGRDVRMSLARVEGYRNFATKLWNAARFTQMNECVRVENFDPANLTQTINKWIAGETERSVRAVTEGIEMHRYNEAASAIYHFIWHIYCDWYLELIKGVLNGSDEEAKAETRAMAAYTLDQILKLLHPFMPYITEELWQQLAEDGPDRETLLILAEWPMFDGLQNARADREIDWIIKLISEVRSVRAEMNIPAGAKVPLVVASEDKEVQGWIAQHEETLKRLARLDSLMVRSELPAGAVQMVVDQAIVGMPLEGVIDLQAERERLNKEIARNRKEIDKIDAKLGNEQFLSRAPEAVVDEQKRRKEDTLLVVKKLEHALERLSGIA